MNDLGAILASRFWSAASAIGSARDVEDFEAACGYRPKVAVMYDLMASPDGAATAAPDHATSYSIRSALPSDVDKLLPLQESYEREEVLTPIHSFHPAACRVALERAIADQLFLVAEEGVAIVGKAGTNARGFGVDQIGGVFVVPERRGRGIGRALMEVLLATISSEGRRSVLFVKPANTPAHRLYRGLGFEKIEDYRADYYEA